MVKIKIDGVEYEVDEKKNLIDATKEVGVEIPYFCYHPALSIVGMCRMCLIEIEGVPRLQAACNTPVKEGMGIITKSDRVKEARSGTMEFLLANHPLDCPVCDKAGECRLQDNAFGSGSGHSRFEFDKRNIPQEEIGTNLIINHNRCIVCYRCVRFEEEKVGESNLGLFERGNHSIIGLAKSEPINHNYQGALADICPVGALLNNKTLFKSRVWWYKSHKSVCHGCSTGCNVTTNVRDNKMYRYMVRENYDQGMFFLCDKGRFDLDWMNVNRLHSYLEAGNPSTSKEVISKIGERIRSAKAVAVLGGAHESNETLESLKKVFEQVSRELGGKSIQWESRVTDAQNKETEQVDFLLTKDNHPNTKGAIDLGITTNSGVSGIVSAVKSGAIDLVILLKESIPEGIDPSKVIVFDTNLTDAAKNASLAAPIQIFAESAGSFTNKNGLKQNFEQSMNPIKGLLSAAGVVDLILQTLTEKLEASVGNR
ncbi:2Fe-2S iron-sulfur cluster-binding protein [Leptospira brenneri]|uniref:NADH dehydrogenase subunit n=1 Tax=Leptospira brenneri TaxID=2023182 RepID=A0A2M9Y5V5_9LEPT|nr:2Fe-2S iron-sulfur cluster-binding protein [Leptospira brenneri]PJZ46960.1 NADH dehydrogenase subunit [Leptospira brenneri]TGK96081.1 NADH dehydrogenase subunit [Leptospira brenneri]